MALKNMLEACPYNGRCDYCGGGHPGCPSGPFRSEEVPRESFAVEASCDGAMSQNCDVLCDGLCVLGGLCDKTAMEWRH